MTVPGGVRSRRLNEKEAAVGDDLAWGLGMAGLLGMWREKPRAADWIDCRPKLWPWRKLMGSVANSVNEMPGIPQWRGLGKRLALC